MNPISKLALVCGLIAGTGSMAATAAEQVLAFPGAEGFGRYTIGGRYGSNGNGTAEIYHVTNLNDSGAGSLRDAVSKSGRIIVFDVCGTINLKSRLVFQGHNTILGQTAPGEGIQVYGNGVSFSGANELIVRHMRFRMGKSGDSGKDAAGVANGKNMIFDHLSVLWGLDENFSISDNNQHTGPQNITVQNSIIGQGLQTHSCGGLIQTDGGVTLYRNLYIENKTRNPKVKGVSQFVNNVLYNWGNGAAYNMGGDSNGTSWTEITDNYFVKGPWKSATRPLIGGNDSFHYYGVGNYYDDNIDGVLNGSELSEDLYVASGGNRAANIDEVNTGMAAQTTADDKSFPVIAGRQTAPEALQWVLKNVGASLPVHDEVDRYIIDELASFGSLGSKDGISTEKQLPHQGTGTLYSGFKPKDSDNDGIPDEWEIANGLNPNDASDAVKINADGYTNIESYVFSLEGPYPYLKNVTGLKSSKIEKNAITISWTDNSDNESGFEIEISTDNKNFTKVGEVGTDVTTYTASGLADNTVYYFRVKTVAEGIEPAVSSVLKSLTIDEPYAPKASTLTSPANGARMRILNAELSWTNNTEDYFGEISYSVYLGTNPENLKEIATGLTATSYVPSDIELDGTYYWRVDATNDVGTTPSEVYSFTVIDGGTLFYTDFRSKPEKFATAEVIVNAGAECDLIAAGKTDELEFGNLIIGTAGGRIHYYPSRSGTAASAEHAGSSKGSVAFIGKNGNVNKSYIKVTDIDGPWAITVYSYNADGKSYSFTMEVAVDTDDDGVEDVTEKLATFNSANSTKTHVTKHTYTYNNETEGCSIILRPVSSSVGFDIMDVLVEKFIPGEVEPVELKSGKLVNDNLYSDGSVSLTFNQDVELDASAITIDGKHQYENISVKASGSTLTVDYEALDINSTYTITIPEGALTNVTGESWIGGDIVLNTSDFPAAKKSGETHWGKAATNLPYDLVPFNSYAGIATVGDHTQSKSDDFPHWAKSDGGVTANSVSFKRVNNNDKVMAYFNSEPKKVEVKLECTSGAKGAIMIQETRNADITPGYRTLRVFTEADLPFEGELPLHPETRFVKVVQKSYTSGTFTLSALKISDSDLTGIDVINSDNDAPVEYYNLQGIRIDNPAAGLYIKRQGNTTTKVLIK